jgi:hypothetical protein
MVFNFNPLMKIKEKSDNKTCHCKFNSPRKTFKQKLEQPLSENKHESVCNEEATKRGPGQRVISFSMFGKNTALYLRGLLRNIDAIKKLYSPQYIIRLYYNELNLANKELLCSIFCTESNVDLCNVNDIGK